MSKNKEPVRVVAPAPEHMRERLRACGWNGEWRALLLTTAVIIRWRKR